jgi:hypothetical protein
MAGAGIFVSESGRAQSRPVHAPIDATCFAPASSRKNKKTQKQKSDNQSESVGIF